jgi:biopolymer transport protein ExbD
VQIARQRRAPVGIDMSPLIDCVFQLLIFFMLSSSFLTPMVQLKLPQAGTHDVAESQEIQVTVDEAGTMFVNTQIVAPEHLRDELAPLLARSRHKVITFRGDEKMQYENFVRVLDAARAAGAVNVNIAHRSLK